MLVLHLMDVVVKKHLLLGILLVMRELLEILLVLVQIPFLLGEMNYPFLRDLAYYSYFVYYLEVLACTYLTYLAMHHPGQSWFLGMRLGILQQLHLNSLSRVH